MKKALAIGSWVLIFALLIVVLGFVSKVQGEKVCSNIDINIDHSGGNYFVEKEDIFAMVYHEIDTIVGRPIDEIQSEKLEYKLNNHPSISNVEIHKTLEGELVIEVLQRTPIVRVFSSGGDSYYLDSTGTVMPPSSNYTSRVFVATGNITDSFIAVNNLDIKKPKNDSIAKSTMIDDIFKFAQYIRKDPLWKAQIEQLYVNKDFEIELIPRVGNHRIVFGDATDLEKKFNKLKVFYKKGLSKTGWNEYSVINLKYANQVVCKKR